MGRGGNDELFEQGLDQVGRVTESPRITALRAELQEHRTRLEKLQVQVSEALGLITDSNNPHGFEELIERIGDQERDERIRLHRKEKELESLTKTLTPDEKREADRYRRQGHLVAERLQERGIMKLFATNLEQVISKGRQQSKDIEQALEAALPEYVMVETPDGKKRKAKIHTAEVRFGDLNRPASSELEMHERFWVDIVVEVEGRMYPFEIKAVADNNDYSDLFGDRGLLWLAGAPADETGGKVVKVGKDAQVGLAADALVGNPGCREHRDVFLVTVHKDELRDDQGRLTTDSVRQATSIHAFSEIDPVSFRSTPSNALQVRAARIQLLDEPRSKYEVSFAAADIMFKRHEIPLEEVRRQREIYAEKAGISKRSAPLVDSEVDASQAGREKMSRRATVIRPRQNRPGPEKPAPGKS